MFKFLLYFIFFFFLIRFVLRVVLPLLGGARQVQQKMRQMQEQMNRMQKGEAQSAPPPQEPKKGEYIDYEEVK